LAGPGFPPALLLAAQGFGLAAARGGTAGAVLNAANEEAVGAFLAGRMRFTGIADVCARVLEGHAYQADPSLDDIRRLDAWARQEVVTWVSS
jgi:1-deoxy-D-xylulose-5-phosphate reductoisomerase